MLVNAPRWEWGIPEIMVTHSVLPRVGAYFEKCPSTWALSYSKSKVDESTFNIAEVKYSKSPKAPLEKVKVRA
jgi:hypothetical protein